MRVGELIDKQLVIQEKPLTNSTIPKIDLKTLSNRPSNPIETSDCWSRYSRKGRSDNVNNNRTNRSTINIINGLKPKEIDVNKSFEKKQNDNQILDGWTSEEIVAKRKELEETLKPETLKMLQNIRSKRIKKTVPDPQEEQFISEINKICAGEKNEEKEELNNNNNEQMETDLSFLPINPVNKYVNMDKVELDKVEWMKVIESKSKNDKLKSIRFHIDGSIVAPNPEDEAEEQKENELRHGPSFDPYEHALRHHGDEPDRNGYTIHELFYLARSKFVEQQAIAVNTLIAMVDKSMQLQHAHRLNQNIIVSTLIDLGLVFLARWLLDDADLRPACILRALRLLQATISIDYHDEASTVNDGPIDRVDAYCGCEGYGCSGCYSIFDNGMSDEPWMISQLPRLIQLSRSELDKSERAEIQDDQLLTEDIVSCLVSRTGFLNRLSFLLVRPKVKLSHDISVILLDILARIAAHSIDTAHALANQNEQLLFAIIEGLWLDELSSVSVADSSHNSAGLMSVWRTIRVVRLLCRMSSSISHKLLTHCSLGPKIISAINTSSRIELSLTSNNARDYRNRINTRVESVSLAATLIRHNSDLKDKFQPIIESIIDINHPRFARAALELLSTAQWMIVPEIPELISVALISDNNNIDYLLLANALSLATRFYQHRFQTINANNDSHLSCFDLTNQFISDYFPIIDRFLTIIFSKDAHHNRSIIDNLVLGLEHRFPNVRVVSRDHASIDNNDCNNRYHLNPTTTRIAVVTRNPQFIDFQPYFIELDPRFALLASVSRVFCVRSIVNVIATNPQHHSIIINRFVSLMKPMVETLSLIPSQKLSSSPSAAIVQSQLASVCQSLLALARLSFSMTDVDGINRLSVLRAAMRLAPSLDSRSFDLARSIFSQIVFDPRFNLIESNSRIIESIFHQIFPNRFSPTSGNNDNQPSISSTCADESFLKTDWINAPYCNRYTYRSSKSSDNNNVTPIEFSPQSVLALLEFSSAIDNLKLVDNYQVDVSAGLRRLVNLVNGLNDWSAPILAESRAQTLIETLLRSYLNTVAIKSIRMSEVIKCSSSHDPYEALLRQYFSISFSDHVTANLVMFPCAMRFSNKYRLMLFQAYIDHIRLITLSISESIVPINEYLEPEETSQKVIVVYWRALVSQLITENRNELLYWIAIHHVNRMMFNRSISNNSNSSFASCQRGIAHAVSNPSWQHKPFVNHLRLYKHFVGTSLEIYDTLPEQREQFLTKLALQFTN